MGVIKTKFLRQFESPYILHSITSRMYVPYVYFLLDLNRSNLDLYGVSLQENKYQEVLEALRNDQVEWNWQGPANKR